MLPQLHAHPGASATPVRDADPHVQEEKDA